MELDFIVTICLGHGDGGDVVVTVNVTDEEYALLVECCREWEEIDGYEGLEDLYKRIVAEARNESESCQPDGEEIDYDDAYYRVEFPDQIYEEANNGDEV